jgi:hypothetical protein
MTELNATTALSTGTLGTDPLAAAPTPAATEAPAAAAPADANTFQFVIPNTETQIGIDIAQVPADVRMDFLRKGLRDYITNAVNQANIRANKANAPFDAHDEATKADPLQTAVPKPAGERVKPDLIATAAAARKRLYDGEIRKQGEGNGTPRATVDPLTKLVTEAVVRELHGKDKAAGGKRKYTEFTAEVAKAGGGIKYLEAKIAEKVASGTDEAVLRKFMDERYIKPAQMMLGDRTNKATDAANSIL